MDVSVGHLNNRLALQLPRELPLGLVFVVGTIDGWRQPPTAVSAKNNRVVYEFNLVEDGYRLHCRLLARTMLELDLDDGVRVRVGGHLRFNAQRATYYLLARDIESLQPTAVADPDPDELPDDGDVLALLADIRERDKTARLPKADLPPWVQRMAPAELQAEEDAPQTAVDADDDAPLDENLVTYLSDAIDQEQDVELTDDVLAQFTPEADDAADDATEAPPAHDDGDAAIFPPPPLVDDAMANTPVAMPPEKMARFQQKRPSAEIDWLVVLLVAALLLVAAIVTIALLA